MFLGRTEPIPLVKKEDSLCLGRLTLEVFTVWWKLPLKVNIMSILAFFSLLFFTKNIKCITRISHKHWISEVTGFRSCLGVYVCSPSRVHFLICCWNETRKINLTSEYLVQVTSPWSCPVHSFIRSLSKQMKQPVTESWWKLRRKTLMNCNRNIRSANWKFYFFKLKFDALVLIIVLFDIHQCCSWFHLFAGNWVFNRWLLAASWKGKPCHLANVLMSLFFTNWWLKEREY